MSEDSVLPGAPAEEHNTETGETWLHDVTVVTHPARGNTPAVEHGWTAPQIALAKARVLVVGCPECRAALKLPADAGPVEPTAVDALELEDAG